MSGDTFIIKAKDPQKGMTLTELGRAVQKAHRLDVPGDARIRVDFPLDFSFEPGSPLAAVHFNIPEGE